MMLFLGRLGSFVTFAALILVLGFGSVQVGAAVLSDCSFENADANDGTWDNLAVEVEATYLGTWTPGSGPDNVATARTGVNAMRFNLTGESLVFSPAVAGTIGYVYFWWSSNASTSTLDLQYSTDGGSSWSTPVWTQSVTGANAYTYSGPIAIFQPGNTILRWYMSARSAGAIFLDDVVILDQASTPTPTITPSPTPTPTPCNGNLYNCGFEMGNTSSWTVSNVSASSGAWGIPVPQPSYYAGDAASYGTKVGNAYQVVTGNTNSVCRLEALCTNWDQRNGSSPINWVDSTQFQIGLDPAGAAAAGGGISIPWSANCRWARYQTPRVSGCGPSVTVWFRYNARYGVEWNFAYFDNFQLTGNPAPFSSVDFQAADLYPGPFYSTYNGNNMTCLAQMVTDVAGAVGRGLKMDPTSTNSTTPSRGIGVFLLEGNPSAVGTVSGWMRCPGAASDVGGVNHWMEFAWKTGLNDAYDFDAGSGWNLIQKFDGYSGNAFNEGNLDTWTQYSTTTGATDANGEISVGVKLGNGGSGAAAYLTNDYWFDEIKLEGALPVNDWMVF